MGPLSFSTFQVTGTFARGGVLDYLQRVLDCHHLVPDRLLLQSCDAVEWTETKVRAR